MRNYLIATALTLAVTLPAAGQPRDNTQIVLAAVAKDLADVLGKANQKEVRLGRFTGDGGIPSSFGPEIQRILLNELGKHNIKVTPTALIEVLGSYRPAVEEPGAQGAELTFLRIGVQVVNTRTGDPVPGVNIKVPAVYGNEVLGRAFGPTVALSPGADLGTRNKSLEEAILKPKVTIDGSRVKSPTGNFQVELLVVDSADAADPAVGREANDKDKKGLAFVDIAHNEYYRVKVHNAAPFDAAVRLTIDGLDQFVFSDAEYRDKDGRPKYQYMIVPKGKSIIIKGWFRNLDVADSFIVTGYSKSAAAELNSRADTGQICVQFYAAWEKDEDKPLDESGKDAATGRGAPVHVSLKPATHKVGTQREQVSIRYNKK